MKQANTEQRYIIRHNPGNGSDEMFLAHQCPSQANPLGQLWTRDRAEAMEYCGAVGFKTASDLVARHGGAVWPI